MIAPDQKQQHLSLSDYLSLIQKAIRAAITDHSWIVAELSDFKRRPNGHCYMDVLETHDGVEVAKARCSMFANIANTVLGEWEKTAGGMPQPGMKLLLKVKADFSPQYGLSLICTSIDPSYTLGDMEAKKQRIITFLKEREWFDLQRSLPAPTGFWNVAVVAPHAAAGLADFQRDAEKLEQEGVCQFDYFAATFQGADTSASIRGALREVHSKHQLQPFDAVCIIRGGGAKSDLAWLNESNLAAWVCRLPAPVFTGIGHETDECILDLVAHRRFDTPSKVIGYIKTSLMSEAASVRGQLERTNALILRRVSEETLRLERGTNFVSRQMTRALNSEARTNRAQAVTAASLVTALISNQKMKLERDWSGACRRMTKQLHTEASVSRDQFDKANGMIMRLINSQPPYLERSASAMQRQMARYIHEEANKARGKTDQAASMIMRLINSQPAYLERTDSAVQRHMTRAIHEEANKARGMADRAAGMIMRLLVAQTPLLDRAWGILNRKAADLLHEGHKQLLHQHSGYVRDVSRIISQHRMALQKAPERFSRFGESLCAAERQKAQLVSARFAALGSAQIAKEASRLELATTIYEKTNPHTLLSRGFALVRGSNGEVVTSAQQARSAVTLDLAFADGHIEATVLDKPS